MKTSQILEGYGHTDLRWSKDPKQNQHKEGNPKTRYNQTVKSQIQNFESKRMAGNGHIQRNGRKAMSGYLCRTLTSQEGVGWPIQSAEKKICQPRLLYQEKLLFRNKGERKIFPNKEREFIPSRLALQETLNEIQVELLLSENKKTCESIQLTGKVNI